MIFLKKFKVYYNQDVLSFILLLKLKYNRDQIHGLNCILANKINFLKIHYKVIFFFCKTHSYIKKETSQSDFSVECGAQLAYQAALETLDAKSFFPSFQEDSKSSKRHKLA
jgi:hypothetical protein